MKKSAKVCGEITGWLIATAILAAQYCGVVFGVILAIRSRWVNAALCLLIAAFIQVIRNHLAKKVVDDDE